MKATVIAFGTRGDVQPLVLLAAGMAAQSDLWNAVVLVTHDGHHEFVRSLLGGQAVAVAAVDSPPVLWKGTPGSDAAETRANLAQQNGCIEACRGANLVIFNMFALEGYHVSEALRIPSAVCHPYLMTASPMPSSFPKRLRRTYPRLYRGLTRVPNKPRLAHKEDCEGAATAPTSSSEEQSELSQAAETKRVRLETAWDHVEHWMWPLFTNRWATFRERLGLDPCPLQESLEAQPSEPRREGLAVADNGCLSSLRTIDSTELPLVLYLFSPLVVDASPYWPESVRVCGYLFPSPASRTHPKGRRAGLRNPGHEQEPIQSSTERQLDPTAAFGSNEHVPESENSNAALEERLGIPPSVEEFLSVREDRPIYVGFGSMWGMCVPGYRLAFALRVLLLGVRQAGGRCLVNLPHLPTVEKKEPFDGAGGPSKRQLGELESATDLLGEFAASAGRDNLLVHHGPLDHSCFLSRCSVAIHHGGSGTTAAVLRAGIPHVVCPQQLDQFFWAERVRYLAVGGVLERSLFVGRVPAPTEPPGPLVGKASAAISAALTPQVKLRAACMGVKIRAESGLDKALDSLSLFMRKRSPTPAAQHREATIESAITQLHMATPSPTLDHVSAGKGQAVEENLGGGTGEILAAVDRVGDSLLSGGGSVGVDKDANEDNMVLREMPNGLAVWWGSRAEEEAFFIYGEVFEDRTYARMDVRVQDGDTVWDVGANVGLASIFFELETDTPDSLRIFAFEPLPINRSALQRNLSEHCPTAVILEYALGAKHEDNVLATFYPHMPGNSTLRPLEKERLQGKMGRTPGGKASSRGETRVEASKGTFFDDAEQIVANVDSSSPSCRLIGDKASCSVRTVSWAMAALGVDKIDLLKIDVEGAELDVLLGIEQQDWPKIKQVVAEVHPVGDRVPRACELLRRHGYDVSVQALGLDGTPLSPSPGLRAADMGSKAHGTAASSSVEKTVVQEQRSGLSQGQSKPPEDGSSRCDGGHQGAGAEWSCGRNKEACDGVVSMVYAKRLS
ncbi:amino acid adenylation domain protein [Ectocarpus siliculosus]|uniref:Amino acid adenylation domain protein n=1 Tax=Ectocarpus siliculosus TaxID=2880 RepID=D7FV91_ECTSI|nr:amino acid adenylation domain protein [Ectocarpus siliculosus]|eukprot:CBJ26263.1 amino acid adenylation domain protein [Ectocarpus siliculosus]